MAEALHGITQLVGEALEDMSKTIPEPLSLQGFNGKVSLRVPPEQHRKLAIEAAESGTSFSRLISHKLA